MDILIIGAAGFLGAISRYFIYTIEKSYSSHNFPMSTLFINLFGCVLAGIILAVAEKSGQSQKHLLSLLSVGFVGSFTTFSTFSMETLMLIENNFYLQASLNVLVNVLAGISLLWLTKLLTSLLI